MTNINPDSLFSIFEQDDAAIYQQHGLDDIMNNPYVVFQTVTAGIENYTTIDQLYLTRKPHQYKKVRQKIKLKYYTKQYNSLILVNLSNMDHSYKIGQHYEIDRNLQAMYTLLQFFEQQQVYEYCQNITKYIEFLMGKKLDRLLK